MMAKKLMWDKEIYPEIHNIDDEPEAREYLKKLNFKTVPVLEYGDRYATGFQPSKIKEICLDYLLDKRK